MGKFKTFILQEWGGLADLGKRLDGFFNNQNLGNQINGVMASTDWTHTEKAFSQAYPDFPMNAPNQDLTIPSVVKTGRVVMIEYKKNPIYVRLSDGTEAFIPYDQYRKMNNPPQKGKVVSITFQRNPADLSPDHSKIESITVLD